MPRIWIYLAAFIAVVGIGYWIYSEIKDSGRQEVITEVQEKNQELDEAVAKVNENVTVRVVTEDVTIRVQSRQVEDVVNEMPSESISAVTRARLERVREQQRSIRETGQEAE